MPADRVAALRAAFAGALSDAAVHADAKKRRMKWDPVAWPEQQEQARRISAADQGLFDRMRATLGVK